MRPYHLISRITSSETHVNKSAMVHRNDRSITNPILAFRNIAHFLYPRSDIFLLLCTGAAPSQGGQAIRLRDDQFHGLLHA